MYTVIHWHILLKLTKFTFGHEIFFGIPDTQNKNGLASMECNTGDHQTGIYERLDKHELYKDYLEFKLSRVMYNMTNNHISIMTVKLLNIRVATNKGVVLMDIVLHLI